MTKRTSFVIFSFLLAALFISLAHNKVSAANPNQTKTNSINIFNIQGGNANDTLDQNGNAILKPHQVRGNNIITLDASLNGRTAELPVGSIIFLRFPSGGHIVSISPEKGVVEGANGIYN